MLKGFILSHLPHAPKYEEEIKSFVDEGMALDSGCMVIEAYGRKDDEGVLADTMKLTGAIFAGIVMSV